MKEQLKSAVLPKLAIVGHLKITSRDGKSLYSIEVTNDETSTVLDPFFQKCFEQIGSFLKGERKKFSLKLDHTSVTPFQAKVLTAMKEIPYGKVGSYKDLAHKINSKAFQAIGSACGRNPFLLIYPCHRVVGLDNLGGFAHGLEMKRKLLALESRI